MEIIRKQLWENIPGEYTKAPELIAYIPENKTHNSAVIIFQGGGYSCLTPYEGKDYALFLAEHGICAFVCEYRVKPHRFPLPLLDARRAIRTVRYEAEKYGIDKNKIAVMGSSAGGHLAAMVSTYYDPIDFENTDEIDNEDFIPNAQILCYSVVMLYGKGKGHIGSGKNLLADRLPDIGEELSPNLIVSSKTPPAFIWHTFNDDVVNVVNSLTYATSLKEHSIPTECHIFPEGRHGMGLATNDDRQSNHVRVWRDLLINWLDYIGF